MTSVADTGRRPSLPLSSGQRRLWFIDRLVDNTSVYNFSRILRLSGRLDVDALHRALNAILARHDALRTVFLERDGAIEQVVQSARDVALRLLDIPPDDEDTLERTLDDLRAQPFDLSRDLMMRWALLRLSPDDHILFIGVHHIAFDAWSLRVLHKELASFYLSFTRGGVSDLPPLAWQYADYTRHEQALLAGDRLNQQLSYWRTQLAHVPAELSLPTDRSRSSAANGPAGVEKRVLSTDLVAALRRTAREGRATFFMLLSAALGVLLQRYGDSDDVVMGLAMAGRNLVETEALIGFFVNTLVLRFDLSGDPTFRELLTRVRTTALEAYSNQAVPFDKVVEELKPDRTLNRSPFFQVIVDHVHMDDFELPGLRTTALPVVPALAKFDMTFILAERRDSLAVSVEYNRDLFDAATIRRLLGHFETLLTSLPASGDQPISWLPLLTSGEERQLLHEWNQPPAAIPEVAAIVDRFEAQVRRTPESIAVVCEGQQLTYTALNARANRLAHVLRRRGAARGMCVGLAAGRSLDVVIGLLGILKSGAAYVPLDSEYPAERLRFMVDDAALRLVVARSSNANALPESCELILLDRDAALLEKESAENLDARCAPDDPAYVIYTSGSTGVPKGVLVTHANVVRLFDSTQAWFHFDADDVWTLFHSPAFDFSVWEIWGALFYGGRLVVVSYETSRSPDAFLDLLEGEQVTVLNQTPTAFGQLVRADGARRLRLARLRLVIFGGEKLDIPSLRPWFDRHGDRVTLVNMYGITETTVHVTYRPITIADLDRSGSPIGRPIPDLDVYVLDRRRRLVPIGVPGEMYVGGAGLALGYLNRAELTEERFVPHPFKPAARVYRSGDLARYRADGDLEFLGRTDDQVKIRGFRVEAGEVEAAIRLYPDVRDAAVALRVPAPGDVRLVAYIIWRASPPERTAALRRFLQTKLPDYMVPSTIVALDAFPTTPSGKLNRAALPMPEPTRDVAEAFVAPRDDVEQLLADIWRDLLQVDRVGVEDDFFELGGHSLLAARMMSEIEHTCGIHLPLATLFQATTVAELAPLMREQGWSQWNALVPIQPRGSRVPLFCVHAVGGNVLGYRDLAFLLGADQPVYGLQAIGLKEGQPPHTAIEEMATHYIERMRAVRPEGPYHLGGLSFGGVVAFEMAQQLQRAGLEVGVVALLDTRSPMLRGADPSGLKRYSNEARSLAHRAGNIASRIAFKPDRTQQLRKMSITARRKIRERLWQVGALPYRAVAKPLPKVFWRVAEADRFALKKYRAEPYPGRLTLFRGLAHTSDPALAGDFGWRAIVGDRLDIIDAPGDHVSILLRPNVEVLARKLRDALQQFDAASA